MPINNIVFKKAKKITQKSYFILIFHRKIAQKYKCSINSLTGDSWSGVPSL